MRQHGQAFIDPHDPRRTALCQRCGTLYNLEVLSPQMEWAGTQLIFTGLRVCPRCLDMPADFLRTLTLCSDPAPVFDALPDGSPMDMVSSWTLLPATPGVSMFPTKSFMAVALKKN